MKKWLQNWLEFITLDMLREYNQTVISDSFKNLEERLTRISKEFHDLRKELTDVQVNVQLLVNENIELRRNLPAKPARQARNFTEFKTMLEEAQNDTRSVERSQTSS